MWSNSKYSPIKKTFLSFPLPFQGRGNCRLSGLQVLKQ